MTTAMTLKGLNPGNILSREYRDALGGFIAQMSRVAAASMTLRPLLLQDKTSCDNLSGDLTLNAVAERVLGTDGLRRFEEFKASRPGWDFGAGAALSCESVATFNAFANAMPELVACDPSLFMTRAGNLSIGWEDEQGGKVEVEFFRDEVEYYIQSLDEEASVKMEAVESLVCKLRTI